jgi:hypothetical protein
MISQREKLEREEEENRMQREKETEQFSDWLKNEDVVRMTSS